MITTAAHLLSSTLGSDSFLCSWRLESFCQRTWPAGRTNAVMLPMSQTAWCLWLKVCALQWPTHHRRLQPSSATAGWGHQLLHYALLSYMSTEGLLCFEFIPAFFGTCTGQLGCNDSGTSIAASDESPGQHVQSRVIQTRERAWWASLYILHRFILPVSPQFWPCNLPKTHSWSNSA